MNKVRNNNSKVKYMILYIISIMLVVISTSIISTRIAMAAVDTSKITIMHDYTGTPNHTGFYVPHEIFEDKASLGPFPLNARSFNMSWDFFCAQHGTPYGTDEWKTFIGAGNDYDDISDYAYITSHKNDHTKIDGDIDTSADFYLDENGEFQDNGNSDKTYTFYKDAATVPKDFVQRVFTNWVYTTETYDFDCENGCAGGFFTSSPPEAKAGETTGTVSHGGFAFVLATKQNPSGPRNIAYNQDPMQWLQWKWLGYASNPSSLEDIASCYENYHKVAEDAANGVNPLYVEPDAHVGTTLSGSDYQVGPFTMSSFSRLKDFSISGTHIPAGSPVATISAAGYETLTPTEQAEYTPYGSGYAIIATQDINVSADNLQQIVFDNVQGKDYSQMVGDLIKVEAKLTNGSSDSSYITLADYFAGNTAGNHIPAPNESNLYFNIPGSYVSPTSYDELKTLKFTYRIIHACGSGTYYWGFQECVEAKESRLAQGCTYYDAECPGSEDYGDSATVQLSPLISFSDGFSGGGLAYAPAHTHVYTCDQKYGYGVPGGCGCWGDHPDYVNCENCAKSGILKCTNTDASHTHDEDCYYHCDGHSIYGCHCMCPENHTYNCNTAAVGQLDFRCPHGYQQCRDIDMKYSTHYPDYCQDGNCCRGDLWYEDVTFEIPVNVPLITQMEIYKYIASAEHAAGLGSVFPTSNKYPLEGKTAEARRDMLPAAKLANPVPVDRGDYITYNIDLVNDSRFNTKVKVEDLLPDGAGEAVYVTKFDGAHFKISSGQGSHEATYFTVPANRGKDNPLRFTIIVRPITDSGIHTNTAKFITKNAGPERMLYEEWGADSISGAHTDGNIVNYYEMVPGKRMEDSDTYVIKEYNVSIDKYIVRTDHTGEVDTTDTYGRGSEDLSRQNNDEATKEANPVPVERGDKITYYIDIYNTTAPYDPGRSDPPYYDPDVVYVNIEDTLPTHCDHVEISVEDGRAGSIPTFAADANPGTFKVNDIKVPKDGTTRVTVTLWTTAYEGTEENNIKFVDGIRNINFTDARDQADEFCVVRDNETAESKKTSSDWYVIKEYNVSIDKYIVRSDHTGEVDNSDTYGHGSEDLSRQNTAEATKHANPVPVERGDKITYYIDIYNTTAPYDPGRDSAPYYDPNKLYVNIEDTLPEHCDNVEITVEDNRAGNIPTFAADVNPGTFKVTDIMVPKNGTTRVTVTLWTTAYTGVEENNIKFVDEIRNINYSPDRNVDDKYCVVKDNETPESKKTSSDWYVIKEYNVNIDKYIYDVIHDPRYAEPSGIDTTIPASDERSKNSLVGNSNITKAEEGIKHENPVYVEYGDTLVYKIVVYNTTEEYDSSINKDAAPYLDPNKVYVNLEDTLPTIEGEDYTVEVDNTYESITQEATKFTIRNMMVPKHGKTTVTVTVIINEHEKGKVEENNVKFIDEIRNINLGPGYTGTDNHSVVHNNPIKDSSSDWYKINNYNTFVDKYVNKYNELIMFENNDANFTAEDSLTNEEGILLESRENTAKEYGTFNDGKFTDNIVKYTNENGEYIQKFNYPLGVEQHETIVYNIKIKNEAQDHENPVSTGRKPATQIIATEVTDKMQVGLQFVEVTGKLYNADGTVCDRYGGDIAVGVTPDGQVTENGATFNVYKYTMTSEDAVINPGEFVILEVTATIEQSNLYLHLLENNAELTELININDNSERYSRIIKNDDYDENISKQQKSREFVRMKDMVIAGTVWLDYNKNGLIDDSEVTGELKEWYNISDSADKGQKQDVIVKLYRVIDGKGELYRTTKTDAMGLYTFGRDQLYNYYTSEYNYDGAVGNHKYDVASKDSYQRIPKCNPDQFKDEFGKYKSGAVYQDYYIEYEYDGVIYKSTVEYANQKNLDHETGDLANEDYKIDSNAYEFQNIRDEFNRKYEYISYNRGYDTNKANPSVMVYDKDGHQSELIEDSTRAMKSRSFIKGTALDESLENTDLLWLYKKAAPGNDFYPLTEHLKYINLGLELREDVDIALVKDVYKVKTTVNGDEMEYSYNQVDGINGDMPTGGFLNNYIINTPYGLEIYDEDYGYRVDQYFSQAVREYKTEASELNIEVTYRISIHNRPTKDDERVAAGRERDTKLDVRISEVMDLYDENFVKFDGDANKTIANKVNTLDDATGEYYLTDKPIKVVEAWYFKEGAGGEQYRLSTNNNNGSTQKVYELDPSGSYGKQALTISNTTTYSPRTDMDAMTSAKGYNALYITGMEGELIPEGDSLDIYVKYVVDKSQLEVKNENLRFDENMRPDDASLTVQVGGGSWSLSMGAPGGEARYFLNRALKLIEKPEHDNGDDERYLEGIAQVNMYSVWYADVESNGYFRGKEASLVDRDSNPGNIGLGDIDARCVHGVPTYINPTDPSLAMTDIDNIPSYDDTAYKTGISISANIIADGENPYPPIEMGESGESEIIRRINGKVWDDSRSDQVGTSTEEAQYVGNGIYSQEDRSLDVAKRNDNVPLNYDNREAWDRNALPVIEETDILVRNANVELVEIVPIPGDGPSGYHYYEQVKANQLSDTVQNIRTNAKGEYELRGFAPGKYIVRYTYGDTVDESIRNYETPLSTVQNDMVIFNGQDYKSTQYNSVLDTIKDPDEIILGLEQPNVSDARDDEIRRLNVIAYSEVMNNRIAEVLKGSAVRAPRDTDEINTADVIRGKFRQSIDNSMDPLKFGVLSPESSALEGDELTRMYDELTENTYMEAETVEFRVRTEKLLSTQMNEYSERKPITISYNNISVDNAIQDCCCPVLQG